MIFTAVTILSKMIGNGLGARMCKYPKEKALQIGIGMSTRGEVALIMAEEAERINLINNEIFFNCNCNCFISNINNTNIVTLQF